MTTTVGGTLIIPKKGDDLEWHFQRLFFEKREVIAIVYFEKEFNFFDVNILELFKLLKKYSKLEQQYLIETKFYVSTRIQKNFLKSLIYMVGPKKPFSLRRFP